MSKTKKSSWIFRLELRGTKVISIFTILLVLIGAGIGGFFLPLDPPEWSVTRRVVAGGLGGLGCAVIVIMSRWVGAYSETQDS